MKEKAGEDGKDGCPVIRMDPDYIDISFPPTETTANIAQQQQ